MLTPLGSGFYNTALGWSAGKSAQGAYAVFIGSNAGEKNVTGSKHTVVGSDAMINNVLGTQNTVLGYKALWENQGGSYNTILGQEAGYGNNGDSNVFIGYKAGYSETGNHKLVIANSDTASLIEGDFQQNYVRINDVLMLPPTDAPTSPQEGMMYLSNAEKKLKIFVNGVWQTIAFE